eukprot:scaffold57337_cov23-Phaeocystis_antarctica.AAC.1
MAAAAGGADTSARRAPRLRREEPGSSGWSRRPGRTCFSELETSKGGSDIIDYLRRAHIAALCLELLGISRQRTDLESRSHGLSEGTAGGRRRRRRVA